MSLTVLRNDAAQIAVRYLGVSDSRTASSIAKLSAGSRIVSAKDDVASLAISLGLRKQVAALQQASVNATQAVSMLQVADGAASQIQNILVRMKSLAVQAGSGQLGTAERAMLDTEYQALKSEVDRVAQNTEFNGVKLIDNGGFTYTLRSLPSHGTLALSGVALGLGDSFTQADIDAGRVKYTHDGSATANDRIIVSVAGADGQALGDVTGAAATDTVEDAEYQASTGVAQIHASAVNARGGTGAGIKIAVLDTGVMLAHTDLDGNIVGGVNILDGALDGGTATTGNGDDDNGHGTHVAGIAAAENNGSGTQGVAYDASILSVKVGDAAGSINANDLADGIDYARLQGANVINLSLGFSGAVPIPNQISDAIVRAVNAGMVVVAAMGNSSLNSAAFPASFAIDPTAKGMLIAVGAVDSANAIASFSNKPGSADSQELFTVVAPGVSILSTTFDGATGQKSGTSMATPYVTGSVAALMSLFPNLSGQEISSLLFTTTDDLGATGLDPIFGRGIIDLEKASVPELALNIAVQPNSLVTTSGNLNVVQGRDALLDGNLLDPSTVYSDFTGPIVQNFSYKIGAGTTDFDEVLVQTSSLTSVALNLSQTDVSTAANADTASNSLDAGLERLLTARTGIGASLNRLQFASGNLATSVENNDQARSTLADLDVASAMTEFASNQVLMQAGISLLAQAANQSRELLKLMA